MYTFGLQRGVIEENNRAEKKLEEEPQEDDSCSQATTAGGLSRSAAFSGTDSGVKKIKKMNRGTACVNREILGGE